MRITLLTATNSRNAGGLFYSVKNLVFSLLKHNCNLQVLSCNDEHSAEDITTWGNIPMTFYNTSKFSLLKQLGYSQDIHKKLELLQPDIIHQQGIWMCCSYASLRYKRKNQNVKTIIAPRGMLDGWAINRSALKKRLVGFLYENENLRKADCIHALCQSEYESIRAFGLKNPVAVIPNGTTMPDWERIYAEKNKKTMLFLGRIHPKKGIKELITAIHFINQQAPSLLDNWTFKIAGWAQEGHQEELQNLLNEYKLNALFEFTGSLYGEQKEKTLKEADVFILPSFSEGLPMAVLEAWSYGLPVIMTEYCNLPEGFAANAAYKIDTDSKIMSEQLMKFFEQTDNQINDIGRNGYNLAKGHFSWENIAKRTLQLYNWLLGKCEKPEFVYE
jgi:poly(glycerol-phosphate) alpha-glucosyltransferase